MKQVYKYDNNGNYIEPLLIEDGHNLPNNCTDKEPPQPNWKPVFNGTKWIETITQEELNALQKQPIPLSPFEQLQKDQTDLIFTLMMNGVL
jgi:hypothetical protein